jgi:deoxyinosine 3'endonuclease (endonuclease V)
MTSPAWETVTRRAAGRLSRRASLLTFGSVALAAASPGVGVAKKKKSGDKCKKKEQQRCSKDAAACRNSAVLGCQGDDTCVELLQPCCDTCSANGFLVCFIDAQNQQQP